MTLRELITHLDKPVVSGSLDTNIGMLAYDSRKVAPGTAFVALRGTHSDGHAFINKAIESGAAAINKALASASSLGCGSPSPPSLEYPFISHIVWLPSSEKIIISFP